jgi:cytochrome bd-type quinol oxidase subunit 2
LELIFEYPLLWLVPALLIAGTLTFFLYRNDQRNANFTPRLLALLAALRFLAFMIIAFLLLKPLLMRPLKL